MNGIDKITDRIAADARQQADTILQNARIEAEKIIAEYEQRAQQDYDAALVRGRADAAYHVERMSGVAQLEARKRKLSAKQEMLDRAFEAARKKLLSLPEDAYVTLLVQLTVAGVSSGTEALIFSVKDRPRYGKKVVVAANEKLLSMGRTAALTLSEEARDFEGGLYIQDGSIENNCTFSTILRMLRQQMAGEVAKLLFD